MQREIAAVRDQTKNLPRPTVFREEWGKPIIASQAWVAELVEAAGGRFVATPGKTILSEAVLELNPEIFVAAWCGAGDRVPLRKVFHTRDWSNMDAFKSSRVYCVPDEYLNTPTPSLIEGLRALAAAIHPEIFPQVSTLRCIRDMQE